jgi:hypothetical protein
MRSVRNLLLPALALLALAACTKGGNVSLSSSMKQDLAKLPQDVQSVFYADVQNLQSTELGKEFRKMFDSTIANHQRDEDYKQFMEATGFDPEKDLHSILVGMHATLDESHDSTHHRHMDGAAYAIIKGNFDENKIVAHIQAKEKEEGKQGLVIESYNGKSLYTGPHAKFAAYFADASTVLAGKADWVKMTIDNQLENKNLTANSGMMSLVDQLPHKDQLWAVGMPGDLMKRISTELSKKEDFKAGHALQSVQSGMFSAKVNDKADIWALAKCATEEDSRLMSEVLKGLLAMAKLGVSDDRELVDMLNRFEIEAKGPEVHLAAKLDKAFFEKLKEKQAARRMAAL